MTPPLADLLVPKAARRESSWPGRFTVSAVRLVQIAVQLGQRELLPCVCKAMSYVARTTTCALSRPTLPEHDGIAVWVAEHRSRSVERLCRRQMASVAMTMTWHIPESKESCQLTSISEVAELSGPPRSNAYRVNARGRYSLTLLRWRKPSFGHPSGESRAGAQGQSL